MIQYRLKAKGNTFKTLQSPSSTSDASTKPFKRTRSVHSKSLTIQLDQILWTCTNASLRCHLSTTNRSSFASAVNESLHRLHCFHGLHRFHCLHGFHRRCLLLNSFLHRLHCFHCFHCFHCLHRLHGLHCLHRLHGLHGSHFGKCELLRAGARSFGEAWAMKTKDMWLRLKCDISAVTLMTSSVVAESSCLQWRKYDVDFDMHHPLCFHLGNRNQFTVTQPHSSQYIPAVRCLLCFCNCLLSI